MKAFSATVLLLVCLFLFSCGGGSKTGQESANGQDSSITAGENKDPNMPADARYSLKSGIITFKATVMMMDQEIITYFDDWGSKQFNEINISFMGQKMKNYTLRTDTCTYTWDPDKKAGIKTAIDSVNTADVNFNKLTDAIIKKFQIKEEGAAVILGRQCKVYSMNFPETGITGKSYIWNGITLKTDASAKGIGVVMEATKIEENVAIAADKFMVPKDVKFKEQPAGTKASI